MPTIIINNESLVWNAIIPSRLAIKIAHALNHAYMRSLSIASAPYTPTEQTDRARYICAFQQLHDAVDYRDAQTIRNLCIEKLRA